MSDPVRDDELWQAAIGWVMREHERPADADVHAALSDWLMQDSARCAVYDGAAFLWLLTGLLPSFDQGASWRMENETR